MARVFVSLVVCGLALSACAPRAELPPSSPSPSLDRAERAGTAGADWHGAGPAPRTDEPGTVTDQTAQRRLEERESRQLGRTWGWVAVGIGASAAVLALGTSWVMLDDLSRRNAHCDARKVCTAVGASANDGLSSVAPVNTISWIVAAAALGTGALLLVAHPTDRSKGMRIGLAPNGPGLSLEARGSF